MLPPVALCGQLTWWELLRLLLCCDSLCCKWVQMSPCGEDRRRRLELCIAKTRNTCILEAQTAPDLLKLSGNHYMPDTLNLHMALGSRAFACRACCLGFGE